MTADAAASADPALLEAFRRYASNLAVALGSPTPSPNDQGLEQAAVAMAALSIPNNHPLSACELWTALAWRILLGPDLGRARLNSAMNYLGGAIELMGTLRPKPRELLASAWLGLSLGYARLPVSEEGSVRTEVFRALRTATRLAQASPVTPQLRASLLMLWADVLTNGDLSPGVRRKDATRIHELASGSHSDDGTLRPGMDYAAGVAWIYTRDFGRAAALLARVGRAAQATGDPRLAGRAFIQAAKAVVLDEKAGAGQRAVRLLERGIQAATAANLPIEAADAYRVLGVLGLERGDPAAAVDAFRNTVRLAEESLGHAALESEARRATVSLALGQQALSLSLVRLGDAGEAAVSADRARAKRLRGIGIVGTAAFVRLQQVAPLLADAFLAAQGRVRAAEISEAEIRAELPDDALSRLGQVAAELEAARQEERSLLERMNNVPGIDGQLGPITLSRMQASVPGGAALVYILPSPYGGTAIVVDQKSATSRRLPLLRTRAVSRQLRTMTKAYDAMTARAADSSARASWAAALDKTCGWLWKACMRDVLHLTSAYERIVVFAAAGLEFLPLHAAWTSTGGRRRYALDHQQISYAPCVDFLRPERTLTAFSELAATVIAGPAPTMAAPLPGALQEGFAISSLFRRPTLLTGPEVTAERTKAALMNASVVHMACHAKTHFGSPFSSYLLLACNEKLTLSDIVEMRLSGNPTVFLSACETGLRDFEAVDEVQSLGAGFLSAGAAEVVSTLWTVDDDASALLAVKYYAARLHGDDGGDALRAAQVWLRDTPNRQKGADIEEMRWLPSDLRSDLAASVATSSIDYGRVEYWAAHHYSGR